MNEGSRVVVAMSGGVDSSVAAALLAQQGYQVIGMMLRLWSEPGCDQDNRCCTPEAMAQARRVAGILNIPFYAVDAQQPFRDKVVQNFIDGYAQGITPNPCLICNQVIRWGFLLQHALSLGADLMATGHYARIRLALDGQICLARAVDPQKDQSYVLYGLTHEQLRATIFPLGEYTKPQVRQLAREFSLPVSERPDSQDLCFLGDGDYRHFLLRHAPQAINPGKIVDPEGHILGQHKGLAFYTIGQRKGLGIFSPQPLYVIAKNVQENTLIVGQANELGQQAFYVEKINWIAGNPPPAPLRLQIKIRYKAKETWGDVTPKEFASASVYLDQPLRDITPGQAAVFYDGEVCLGGGIITSRTIY